MITDRQGNPVSSATREAAQHFDQAVGEFNLYRGDPVATADRALGAAPEFVMAHVLKAYLYGLATEPQATAEARKIVEQARSLAADAREASHLAILDHLLVGNWTTAAVAADFHNIRYPRDLLGLQAGHLMDFYRANARDLRDRMARGLPHWSATTPGYGVVLGMYAFGLEEAGDCVASGTNRLADAVSWPGGATPFACPSCCLSSRGGEGRVRRCARSLRARWRPRQS